MPKLSNAATNSSVSSRQRRQRVATERKRAALAGFRGARQSFRATVKRALAKIDRGLVKLKKRAASDSKLKRVLARAVSQRRRVVDTLAEFEVRARELENTGAAAAKHLGEG